MVLHEYTYVFAIGTMFALLEAYNNGASTYSPTAPHDEVRTSQTIASRVNRLGSD